MSIPRSRTRPTGRPNCWPNSATITGLAAAHRCGERFGNDFRAIRKILDDFNPDFVLVWGDDQYENFKEDIVPPFCVLGYDAEFDLQPWQIATAARVGKPNRWGEPGDWTLPLKGHREAAKHIATGLIERGIDLAYAYKPLHHPMAHAFTNTFLYLDWDRQGFPVSGRAVRDQLLRPQPDPRQGRLRPSVRAAAAGRRGRRPAVAAALALHGCRRRGRRGAGALAVPGGADRLVVVVALLPVAEKRLSVAGPRGRPHPVRRAGARRLGDLAQALAGRHGIFRAARDAELDGARSARWRRSTGSR